MENIATRTGRLIADMRASVMSWYDGFMNNPISQAVGLDTNLKLMRLYVHQIRWYAVMHPMQLQHLWGKLIPQEPTNLQVTEYMTDFIIGGTSRLALDVPMSDAEKQAVYDHIALSITWVGGCSVIPDVIKESSIPYDEVKRMLISCPWTLFLFILSTTPVESSVA